MEVVELNLFELTSTNDQLPPSLYPLVPLLNSRMIPELSWVLPYRRGLLVIQAGSFNEGLSFLDEVSSIPSLHLPHALPLSLTRLSRPLADHLSFTTLSKAARINGRRLDAFSSRVEVLDRLRALEGVFTNAGGPSTRRGRSGSKDVSRLFFLKLFQVARYCPRSRLRPSPSRQRSKMSRRSSSADLVLFTSLL